MIFGLLLALTGLMTLTDLVSAWLYAGDPLHWGIEIIRFSRDGLMAALAVWGAKSAYRTGPPFLLSVLYIGWIAAYLLLTGDRVDESVAMASAAKLALPVLLLSVGYGGLTSPVKLTIYTLFLATLACLSTAFGAWDINHTEFWTDTLQYGHYLNGVKGIVMGFDGYYVLPFNFFGFEETRRAAGLVAAPLAQGSFVAIGCMLGFAALQRRAILPAVGLLAVGLLGIWQSGTRGAMLVLAVALPVHLILSGRSGGMFFRNLFIMTALALASFETVSFIYSYSVNLEDGSTIGHVDALKRNLEDMDKVWWSGPGIGASGSVAADEGLDMAGGGEGAIFAIAYQIGAPAALVFLCFYGASLLQGLAGRHLPGTCGDLCLAVFALGVGIVPTLISSDHIFSLSGMGVFWIMLGGVLAQASAVKAAER